MTDDCRLSFSFCGSFECYQHMRYITGDSELAEGVSVNYACICLYVVALRQTRNLAATYNIMEGWI